MVSISKKLILKIKNQNPTSVEDARKKTNIKTTNAEKPKPQLDLRRGRFSEPLLFQKDDGKQTQKKLSSWTSVEDGFQNHASCMKMMTMVVEAREMWLKHGKDDGFGAACMWYEGHFAEGSERLIFD
jgi:hypothetical protein